jgi:hypothetical protein
MSKIPESTTAEFLCTSYGYSKKILTDQQLVEKLLVRYIQANCHQLGYKLLEIKIEKL